MTSPEPSPPSGFPIPPRRAAGILAGLCLLAFANTFGNKFALDDNSIIVQNSAIESLRDWRGLFTSPYWGSQSEDKLYRPLTVLTYAIDRAVARVFWDDLDLSPKPFHFTNLLLHVLATLALYAFLRALLGKARESEVGAFAAAAIFAVHPIHVEAVTGIVGRAEVLCALFYFLGARAYLACRDASTNARAWAAYAGVLVCFALALLCKEMALTLPGILFLCDAYRLAVGPGLDARGLTSARLIAPQTGFIAVIVLYFWVRAAVLGQAGPTSTIFALYRTPADVRILTAITVLADYVRLLFVPVGLRAEYSVNVVPTAFSGWGDPWAWISLVSLLALAVVTVRIARRHPLAAFASAWFFLSIVPVSNLILPIGSVKAERFLYIPSVAAAIAIPWLLGGFRARPAEPGRWGPPRFVAAIAAILVVFLAGTLVRNVAWKDEKTLYADAIAKDPERNARAYSWLGTYYASYRRLDEAMEHIDRAISIWERYPLFYEARGLIYQRREDSRRALVEFNRAIELSEGLNRVRGEDLRANLPAWQRKVGAVFGSIEEILQEYGTDRGVAHPRLLRERGGLLLQMALRAREEGDREGAARLLLRARADLVLAVLLNPLDALTINECGALYMSGLQQYDTAIALFEWTLQRDPTNVLAVYNTGLAYYHRKDLERACRWFDAAIRINPLLAIAYEARGVALYELGGDKSKAGKDLIRAVDLDPDGAARGYNYLFLCLDDLGQRDQAMTILQAMRKGGIPILPEVRERLR